MTSPQRYSTDLIRLAALLCGLLFASLALAQAPATGVIEGRVFDPRRGEYLEKARLTLEGGGVEALTDSTGQYRITNVPAGTGKLVVCYTG